MLSLKKLVFYVIGGIILLHSFVPHEHIKPTSDIVFIHNHQCAIDIFGEIKLSFGTDHGEGHFEHFVKIIQPSITPDWDNFRIELIPNRESESITVYSSEDHFNHYSPPAPLRGPPLLLI